MCFCVFNYAPIRAEREVVMSKTDIQFKRANKMRIKSILCAVSNCGSVIVAVERYMASKDSGLNIISNEVNK